MSIMGFCGTARVESTCALLGDAACVRMALPLDCAGELCERNVRKKMRNTRTAAATARRELAMLSIDGNVASARFLSFSPSSLVCEPRLSVGTGVDGLFLQFGRKGLVDLVLLGSRVRVKLRPTKKKKK